MTEASHDLLVFLSHMETFPHTFSDPEYGYQVAQIRAFAAELRLLANLPRPPTPLLQSGPAPEGWEVPEYRYMGNCNGCLGPLFEVITDAVPQEARTINDLMLDMKSRVNLVAHALGWNNEDVEAVLTQLEEHEEIIGALP